MNIFQKIINAFKKEPPVFTDTWNPEFEPGIVHDAEYWNEYFKVDELRTKIKEKYDFLTDENIKITIVSTRYDLLVYINCSHVSQNVTVKMIDDIWHPHSKELLKKLKRVLFLDININGERVR